MFLQEKMVKIANCSEELCDWEEFKEKYACAISCPFQKMCNNGDGSSTFCTVDYGLNRAVFLGDNINLILLITILVVSGLF